MMTYGRTDDDINEKKSGGDIDGDDGDCFCLADTGCWDVFVQFGSQKS